MAAQARRSAAERVASVLPSLQGRVPPQSQLRVVVTVHCDCNGHRHGDCDRQAQAGLSGRGPGGVTECSDQPNI